MALKRRLTPEVYEAKLARKSKAIAGFHSKKASDMPIQPREVLHSECALRSSVDTAAKAKP